MTAVALKSTWVTGDLFYATDANQVANNVNGVTLSGTYASMPAAGQPARLYFCTDCDAVYQDNGTAWQRVAFGQGGTTQGLPTSGWSTNSMGTSSVAASLDGYLMTQVGTGSGTQLRAHYRTLSPTSNYTATFYIDWTGFAVANWNTGLLLSDGTKFILFGINGSAIWIGEYNSSTSYNSAPFSSTTAYGLYGDAKWWRIVDDSTNLYFQVSLNGIDFVTLYQMGRTSFLTATQIGWGADVSGGATTQTQYGRLRSLSGVS